MRRSWKIFGSGKSTAEDAGSAGEQVTEQASGSGAEDHGSSVTAFRPFPSQSATTSNAPRSPEAGFMGFRSSRANQDARMEKEVSNAARNLGDGVQKIVMAAKARQGDNNEEWKGELLDLLGAGEQQEESTTTKCKSDIDTLLASSSCSNFVLRCVENELPPNLIHCLRLLRVLELQHAASASDDDDDESKPIGAKATSKVSRLLCLLCVDASVGEQLRPHLFGLLALSGASYPSSGVHVAKAASEIIVKFAENCLTRQLVWFIHDRKMVLHMTDDIKELCGMSSAPSSSPPVAKALSAEGAEQAGLLAVALETVVKLVGCSCAFQTVDLVKDFEVAGGYDVVDFAIKNSTAPFGRKIIELLPVLASCPDEATMDDGMEEKMATNVRVFGMLEELLINSNPLLQERRRLTENEQLVLSEPGPLPELASLSLSTGVKLRTGEAVKETDSYGFDVKSALLEATLQLFSDHPSNYDILEGRQHILTYYLLAFPCFDDEDLKNFVLKTLEFVLTGVGVTDEVTPVNACVEIFFALCQTLMKGEGDMDVAEEKKPEARRLLVADLDLMGNTLEKLLQFDQRVAPLMVESGILTTNLNALLDLVAEFTKKNASDGNGKHPPESTPLDQTFCIFCRVLKLLVAHQPVNFSKDSDTSRSDKESTNLHTLLRRGIKELGPDAAPAAAGVFEAYMASFASFDGLESDMRFTLQILRDFADMSVSVKDEEALSMIIDREAVVISLIRSVLEARTLARDAFRTCGGFDTILRVILSFENVASNSAFPSDVLVKLLQAVIGLVDAAIGMKSRNPIASHDISPLMLSANITVDPSSSQLSSRSPSAMNRNFLRQRGFYLDLAVAIAGTGVLTTDAVRSVFDLSLNHVDPELKTLDSASKMESVRNPDGVRLVLGIAAFTPRSESSDSLCFDYLDILLRLCDEDKLASTLPEIASCGICYSITNPKEFANILFDEDHHLRHQLFLLLSRLSSFSMSYMDFISTLRCFVGPLLVPEGSDGRTRLPVISSSLGRKTNTGALASDGSSYSKQREDEFSRRLDSICEIARSGDRIARVKLGGDSINTIAVLMHKVKLEERLRAAAEEGRLRFLEVERIDSSSLSSDSAAPASTQANASSGASEVWSPLVNSGFTYSFWLRHDANSDSETAGNLYILDISSPILSSSSASQAPAYLSVWYDIRNQRFNVMSSASYRGEPTCFPVSPLLPNVWHHVLMTYAPSKRSMMSRKSAFCLYVNGRALEAEIRVESVNLPPNSRVIVGAPNPALATSGIVRGVLPIWELGPSIMLSTVLLDLDATALFAYGPDFPALLWGDRPQRTSLAATATLAFEMLSECGEQGSIASALKRRDIQKLEAAGYCVLGHSETVKDNLSVLGLLCSIPPECVLFAFNVAATTSKLRNETSRRSRKLSSDRIVNLARLNFSNENTSTDAVVYGKTSVIAPLSFADNLRWAGGPAILMPLVNSTTAARTLASTLEIVREGTRRHPPNLEMMQAGGGYRILAVLLREKGFADCRCLDECLAFAINGFTLPADIDYSVGGVTFPKVHNNHWVLSDVDAMKHLLLNHQVWDLQKCGPEIPLRLLHALNILVDQRSLHKSFNARRLHLVGIVRWALHLMLEAAELYSAGEKSLQDDQPEGFDAAQATKGSWYCESPLVSDVTVGGDPGNPFLLECKNLLRRVLTFMLTPGDLEALADAIVYTLSISGSSGKPGLAAIEKSPEKERPGLDQRMLPGPTARLYLIRLLEELIVDGVNEIVASAPPSPKDRKEPVQKRDSSLHNSLQCHAGGVASPNQPYLSTATKRGRTPDGGYHPKHHQAQAFLSAFGGFLTPVWFATVLEGCREEASASAVLRLLILMLQGSESFESAFGAAGGFAPFVLSVPKFSMSPGITMTMLSQLLNVPILHLHSFPSLDPEQLCEVFDAESTEFDVDSFVTTEPSSGVFALLAECLGRNIKIILSDEELGQKARATNEAVVQLIAHRHELSPAFQEFCTTRSFLEPLSQALCLVYNERLPTPVRRRRRSLLADVPRDLTPTERFVGGSNEVDSGGIGFVRLLRMVVLNAITAAPRAAMVLYTVFRSFPIHASPEQVAAFHLVLIEQCRSVIKEILEYGDSVSLANCIGVCSVLLDQQIGAFLTAEAVLESSRIAVLILNTLVGTETEGARALGNAEYSMLTVDAAHMASLICVAALRMSLPLSEHDRGDEDLQAAVLEIIDSNIEALLLVPKRDSKANKRIPTGPSTKPSQTSKLFPVWQSASMSRCVSQKYTVYPDLSDSDDSQIAVVAPLLVALHKLLLKSREDVRSLAVSVLVALLQHRQSVTSDLLVAEVSNGSHTETIDVVNRGGFRALVAAHEAATISDSTSVSLSVKRKYASFFDWFERNQNQVQLVFDAVEEKADQLFPGLKRVVIPQDRAVSNEQKLMLMRLTAEASDSTILGGIERGELARRCAERTTDSHTRWKRQGFDDLAFGATKWKVLLRQLKGSSSLWEGGSSYDNKSPLVLEQRFLELKSRGETRDLNPDLDNVELVKRWKLDLTEGHERQRRRLLPNYEFHGLYNLDEDNEQLETADMNGAEGGEGVADNKSSGEPGEEASNFLVGPEVEATAALLKDLNLKRSNKTEEDEEEDYDIDGDDSYTVATTASVTSTNDGTSAAALDETVAVEEARKEDASGEKETEVKEDMEDSSSYGLITGLLQAGDWPEKSYNVRRCTGLEVTTAILLWCKNAIYVIDGFEYTGGAGMDGRITRVERERASFYISLRPKDFIASDEKTAEEIAASIDEKTSGGPAKTKKELSRQRSNQMSSSNDVVYQHRSQRISFSELHSVYRRRYQLQQSALEFYDLNKNGTFIAFSCSEDREEVLSKVLQAKLPNSIFNSSYGTFISYNKFMHNLKAKIVSQWVNGKMTNFDFLMHLNSFAGRSFNDLTQYPVFPWVIADYESEEIDLNDPKTYRDLSKPMGAIGEQRAKQFHERYEALASTCFSDEDPPPFHYGTHYSSAAYVLYYLMRLEPFSRLALALQGGRFDVADRLFHDIGRSWKSASSENLQDVRELIPEFFYLPDFLVNTNHFDFGETQRGKTVHDVTLPKWAKGDPQRFVRINRLALESEYVSRHLHNWIDLVFGYKQRGQEAIESLNVFVHVTYEGEVDLETMSDPVQRASTIAQIQNFGQTPSRLERKPFSQRLVPPVLKERAIDFGSLLPRALSTPPFCVVGAPHRVSLHLATTDTCLLGLGGQSDASVGDMCLTKGQLIGVGRMCALIVPSKKYFRFGGVNNGVSVHAAAISTRYREVNKVLSFHDGLHRMPITAAKASAKGDWLITGCADSTIRVWRYDGSTLDLCATLCGHDGSQITCIDVSTEFGVIASGCGRGRVLLWDLRTFTFVRSLRHDTENEAAISVSINNKNGNITTLVGPLLSIFDINGNLLGSHEPFETNRATCAVSTDCPEWMEKGILAVTGHLSGEVRLWRLNFENKRLFVRYVLQDNPHTSAITALRVTGIERQDTLLVGDGSGKMSVWKTAQLDSFSSEELSKVVAELESSLFS